VNTESDSESYEFIGGMCLFDQLSCSFFTVFHSSIPRISTNRFHLLKKKKKKKSTTTIFFLNFFVNVDIPYTATICRAMNEIRRPTHNNHAERRRNKAGQNLDGVIHCTLRQYEN
jgi:hypothetical protein